MTYVFNYIYRNYIYCKLIKFYWNCQSILWYTYSWLGSAYLLLVFRLFKWKKSSFTPLNLSLSFIVDFMILRKAKGPSRLLSPSSCVGGWYLISNQPQAYSGNQGARRNPWSMIIRPVAIARISGWLSIVRLFFRRDGNSAKRTLQILITDTVVCRWFPKGGNPYQEWNSR